METELGIKSTFITIKAWICSERQGDGFAGIGGDSAYQEALEVIMRGSW